MYCLFYLLIFLYCVFYSEGGKKGGTKWGGPLWFVQVGAYHINITPSITLFKHKLKRFSGWDQCTYKDALYLMF